MLLSDNFYFCKHCKSIKSKVEDLLFVEEGSPNSFCSEVCIEKFYSPLISHFTTKINKLRADLKLLDEDAAFQVLEDAAVVEKLLTRPDKIWRVENQLKEEIYSYIKEIKKAGKSYFIVAICFVFNKSPSFILAITATANDYFAQQFQIGTEIESIDEFYANQISGEYQIDADLLEQVEQKKSQYLADHLTMRKDVDIPFEQFDLYVDYLAVTLDEADESYSSHDDVAEEITTYIKAFSKSGVSFFYIVICLKVLSEDEADVIVPVFSFPTIDGKLCDSYRNGEQVTGTLKN